MNLALFDFDGTSTSADTFTPFLRYSARPAKLAVGIVVLSPLIVGRKLILIPNHASRPLAARFAFKGEGAVAIREFGGTYARNVIFTMLRPDALDRIEGHRDKGNVVVVVSTALDVYLRPWCESVGITDVICTTLEESDGKFTGRYVEGDCCGQEKLRLIRARYDLAQFTRIFAYGDSERLFS